MGVLPLEFPAGESWQSMGLTGEEFFDIQVDDALKPRQSVPVMATSPDGSEIRFDAPLRIDTPVEMDYYRNGGILPAVLRMLLDE